MTKCKCGGTLETVEAREPYNDKHYQCKECDSTYPKVKKQLCDCCNDAVLTEHEKQIVLGNYYCHSCLISKFIVQGEKLRKYKSNPNKKYNDLKKRITSIMEFIKGSSESIIDECVEITEDRIADFNACREMDMSFNHAKIIV